MFGPRDGIGILMSSENCTRFSKYQVMATRANQEQVYKEVANKGLVNRTAVYSQRTYGELRGYYFDDLDGLVAKITVSPIRAV